MIKRICFFTVGFAFNRQVRMEFYERIFPKDIEIFLVTTDKYKEKEKEHYQSNYKLKRTKIYILNYNLLTLPFALRRFCEENKIDRIINLGFHTSGVLLFLATLFKKTDYLLNIFTDIFNQYKIVPGIKNKSKDFLTLALLFSIMIFAKKGLYTYNLSYKRAPSFFLSTRYKMRHLAAPVNTDLFFIKDRIIARKKLNLPLNKKIVIFVGRIEYLKCSDILKRLIEENINILFILIGRLVDKDIWEIKSKNLKLIEKKSSKELVDYYNASDFSFCVNRSSAGIGLSSEEALACGVPIVVSKEFKLEPSKALYQVQVDFEKVNKVVREFFSFSEKKKRELSRIARNYTKKYYSDNVWKDKYVEACLH